VGLNHVLLEATGDGHCALPVELMKEEAGKLLLVNEKIVTAALERTLANRELIQETIASRIKRLCESPSTYPPIDLEKAVAWCEQKTAKELAPSQRQALKKAIRSRVLVITGGPGVGKTTLVNAILLILRAKKVRCQLCAPTGRAAKRLSEATGIVAKTIHRRIIMLVLSRNPNTTTSGQSFDHYNRRITATKLIAILSGTAKFAPNCRRCSLADPSLSWRRKGHGSIPLLF
jgi:exodeoxyribonuclease V alpha subunit